MEATCTEPDLWTILPFEQATWRSTHRLTAEDVEPCVLEVLDLPILNLAAAQDEDPELQFVKELLRDHDVQPPWDIFQCEKSQQKLKYYGHNSTG